MPLPVSKKIFIIDGSSFLYRAYYAIKPMHAPNGVPVNAVFGFCRMIKKLLDTFLPEHIVLVWDSKGKTARHELYESYKATRQTIPSDLIGQKELIQEFAALLCLEQVQQPGVEADDLMYSLALEAQQNGYDVVVVSSDKDMGQIVTDHIVLYDAFKELFIDRAALEAKYGFPVEKLSFYFALVGDSSDNIPGVAGIGPKTATELVQQFSSLAQLYENIATVKKDRTRALLIEHQQNAFLSEQLFLLKKYPLMHTADQCVFEKNNWLKAQPFFEKYSFKSLLKDMPRIQHQPSQWLSKTFGFAFLPITTVKDLQGLCERIAAHGSCALDTETNGQPAYQSELVGISLCYEKGTSYYIPLAHTSVEHHITRAECMQYLKPILEDRALKKYLHNAKFDMLVLSRYGIELRGLVFDTLIAADLVTSDEQRIGLKFLSEGLLQQPMLSFSDVVKKKEHTTFADVSLELATEYAAADAHQTLQLVPVMQKELAEKEQATLFQQLELPLIPVLYEMEKEGIILDTFALAEMNVKVVHALGAVKEHIIELIGSHNAALNFNSPQQLSNLLFTELKLEPVKKTAQKTGFSTDQEVLEVLAKQHPVPRAIIRYRELTKLKNTYLDALPTMINPFTGRIHTSYSQTSTATGRLASSDPNLQNIPLNEVLHGVSIRSAFKAPEGELFISADYSQIELRVLAYLSQDEYLMQAFLHDEDIHAHTAAKIFDLDVTAVTHEQRQLGKRINFSILYGLTPYGLSKDLDISYSEAKAYIEKYFAQYPGVSRWMERVIQETKQHGYVTTLGGRRRAVPGIYEKNRSLYDAAVRIAISTCGQGTAAEIMKQGMLNVHAALKKYNGNARMVLQIHDELLLTVKAELVADVQQEIVQILQNVVQWNVPLKVSVCNGPDWGAVSK